MGFEQLIHKVTQAEQALEASERSVAADWRQMKASWRQAWTPGRIVVAGLASGFLVGRAKPLSRASGSGVLQMVTALSGLIAGGSAQAAAEEAGDVARMGATGVAEGEAIARPAEATRPVVTASRPPEKGTAQHLERLRRDGLV